VPLIADFESPRIAEPLEPAEVRQLWWFLDGAIMHADTRVALRRSWGLCARHAWAMALVEIELRGGVPFATTVLYADLAGGATEVLTGHHVRSPIRRLAGDGECPTCAYARNAGHEPREWGERTKVVNRRTRFSRLLSEAWEDAVARSCPACLRGDGPPCRLHLLAGIEPSDDLGRDIRRLTVRVRAYEKSLTADGRPVDARGRQAWLNTLGWFAGWRFPAECVRVSRQRRRALAGHGGAGR
jgi:hypothetical protein